MNKKNLTLTLSEDEIVNFDKVVSALGFKSRADFARYIADSPIEDDGNIFLIGSSKGFKFRNCVNKMSIERTSTEDMEYSWAVGSSDKISVRFSREVLQSER